MATHWISHRGNLDGSNPDLENTPALVEAALGEGFEVMVDVRMHEGELWLGHDRPRARVSLGSLMRSRVWCKAADLMALHLLLDCDANVFYSDFGRATVTSNGGIWLAEGVFQSLPRAIVTMHEFAPELAGLVDLATGVCSNSISCYREACAPNRRERTVRLWS